MSWRHQPFVQVVRDRRGRHVAARGEVAWSCRALFEIFLGMNLTGREFSAASDGRDWWATAMRSATKPVSAWHSRGSGDVAGV
jgi:hypothetical protein